ncbi:MAG: trimethylamine methyltransferase family protein, partial [Paracoccaceae bacterium]
MTEPQKTSRGGRKARHRARAAGPANPCPPGQPGGQYKPLDERGLREIYDTALRLLSDLGMGEVPDRLARDLVRQGAEQGADDRVRIPRSLVEAAIAGAAKQFPLYGRDPARDIMVGGEAVHFGTGGAAVQTLDLETGRYRPSTLRDLADFTRLQDRLENVSWFTRCCVATDMVGEEALDINTAYALLRGTTKPVATSFTLAEFVDPIVKMMDMAEGRVGAFSERPWLVAHISPMISPMRYG